MEPVTVEVPRGIPAKDGKWIRKAVIRYITGNDEQTLLEMPQDIPFHQRVMFLLERIVKFDVPDINTGKILRQISIGDRTALLLHTRKMILGDTIPCTITCASCARQLSLDLTVSGFLKANYPDQREIYELETGGYSMKIRPLNTLDQDTIVESLATRNSLEEKLAKSCIANSVPELPSVLPQVVMDVIGAKLGEIDPLSDIILRVSCPECNNVFQASFPVEEFIFREFVMNYNHLEYEVHLLAFNYCWSEHEILALPVRKRKKYVDLINATLSGERV